MLYLTIHPAMGLFWQSPVLILSMIGLGFMWHAPDYRALALVTLAVFLSLVVIISGYSMWWGGQTFGPRHIIPMLPFLCLPLVFIPRGWFYSLFFPGLISILQMFIAVLSTISVPDGFYLHIDQQRFFAYSSIYSYCLKLLLAGDFSTNIVNKLFGIHNWISLVPLLLVILVITLVFFVRRDSLNGLPGLKKRAPVS